ncbi:hypothetical protein, partial [Paenibacillus donghaensis]|uniref:hypothetical protein n=1 Tax=Paenibacillus donghaensis TaxID=414771 RepID=UPI001D16E4D6
MSSGELSTRTQLEEMTWVPTRNRWMKFALITQVQIRNRWKFALMTQVLIRNRWKFALMTQVLIRNR